MLLNLLLLIESSWKSLLPQLSVLTTFAVDFRYPGMTADKALAKQAHIACQEVRQIVRSSLGL
jgi:hypothetical protein